MPRGESPLTSKLPTRSPKRLLLLSFFSCFSGASLPRVTGDSDRFARVASSAAAVEDEGGEREGEKMRLIPSLTLEVLLDLRSSVVVSACLLAAAASSSAAEVPPSHAAPLGREVDREVLLLAFGSSVSLAWSGRGDLAYLT